MGTATAAGLESRDCNARVSARLITVSGIERWSDVKVILLGATGMVGQGVLRECLLDPEVEDVLAIRRNATGQKQEKLHEVVREKAFRADSSSILKIDCIGTPLLLAAKRLRFTKRKWSIEPEEVA